VFIRASTLMGDVSDGRRRSLACEILTTGE
jgi:hypothetical protein